MKNSNKPHVLRCIRDDGSVTWFKSESNADFFAQHDLMHYSIETTLGFSQAFYGLVASGRDLTDFGTKNGVKDPRPYAPEAGHTEQIAGFLQRTLLSGHPVSYPEFISVLQAAATPEHPVSSITELQLEQIMKRFKETYHKWQALPDGEVLELEFPT